jgi:RimJ/RimL family protein N-acetyltransferase
MTTSPQPGSGDDKPPANLPDDSAARNATAARAVAERARAQHRHQHLHAYPAVDHPASNAVCRKAGFTLLGETDFEYPPGNIMRCNDWQLEL